MARSDSRNVNAPAKPKAQLPVEAVGLFRDPEGKWNVVHMQLIEEMVCEAKIVERSMHKDLAQDAARRLVLRLR
jgi:hypothetical protein